MFRGSDLLRRNRRGRDDEKTLAAPLAEAPAFEVELCELVETGDGDALLRVAGRWPESAPERVLLVRFSGGTIEPVEPLPPGPGPGQDGLWHVAFHVPA